MKYRIKRIKSREMLYKRLLMFFGIIIYFSLFVISKYYENIALCDWLFEIHKKLPK